MTSYLYLLGNQIKYCFSDTLIANHCHMMSVLVKKYGMTIQKTKKIHFQEVNINGPIYYSCSSSINRYHFTKTLSPNFEFSQKMFPKILQ